LFTTYEWIYGIAQFSAGFLSVIAGIIALSMFRTAKQNKILRSWRFLIIGLVLFAVEEVLGALKTFGIYSTPHLTHVIPFFILLFVIAGVLAQINITKGWLE
jgi:heme A synthase